jgi:outer membrane protein TolC
MVGVATPPRDEGLKVAMSHRADLAQAEQDVGDAERNAEVAWRGMLPDLNAVARYERFEAAPMVSQSRRFDETIWFLGLSGSVDLTFEKRRVAAEQARIAKDSALQALSSAKLTVEKEVNEAYEAKERAESEAAIREENARVARARVNLAHVLFELGRVDAFGVTDAEQADVAAEEELLVSRGEADLAGYRLRRALGTLLLVPDELQAKERGP